MASLSSLALYVAIVEHVLTHRFMCRMHADEQSSSLWNVIFGPKKILRIFQKTLIVE
jgi:hypothetical protein